MLQPSSRSPGRTSLSMLNDGSYVLVTQDVTAEMVNIKFRISIALNIERASTLENCISDFVVCDFGILSTKIKFNVSYFFKCIPNKNMYVSAFT